MFKYGGCMYLGNTKENQWITVIYETRKSNPYYFILELN